MGLTIDHIVSKYNYLHETDMMLAQYLEYCTAEDFLSPCAGSRNGSHICWILKQWGKSMLLPLSPASPI